MDIDIEIFEAKIIQDPIKCNVPHIILDASGCRDGAYPAFFSLESWRTIWRHAELSSDREVGGILVGQDCYDSQGPFIDVSAAIRAEGAVEKKASLTFTHDTWVELNRIIEKDYSGLAILGWYHTHPGFGPFMSGDDCFIHTSFFDDPKYVALVIDPLQKKQKLFRFVNKVKYETERIFVYVHVNDEEEIEKLAKHYCNSDSHHKAVGIIKHVCGYHQKRNNIERVAVCFDDLRNTNLPGNV